MGKGITTWVSTADINADSSDVLVDGICHEGALALMGAVVEIAKRDAEDSNARIKENMRRTITGEPMLAIEEWHKTAAAFLMTVRRARPRSVRYVEANEGGRIAA